MTRGELTVGFKISYPDTSFYHKQYSKLSSSVEIVIMVPIMSTINMTIQIHKDASIEQQ
uniref:Uncharacterized protein n=1 Tax=Rhizophora mucronata TaxID=61149 RepID=A0A2P2LKM2_RHIMU